MLVKDSGEVRLGIHQVGKGDMDTLRKGIEILPNKLNSNISPKNKSTEFNKK